MIHNLKKFMHETRQLANTYSRAFRVDKTFGRQFLFTRRIICFLEDEHASLYIDKRLNLDIHIGYNSNPWIDHDQARRRAKRTAEDDVVHQNSQYWEGGNNA